MTSIHTGQHSLVMKSFIVLGYAWASLCSCLSGHLKFSHDAVIILGHQRDERIHILFIL